MLILHMLCSGCLSPIAYMKGVEKCVVEMFAVVGGFFVLICFLLFEIILFLPSLFFCSNFARGLSSGSSVAIKYNRGSIDGIKK